MKIRRNTFSAMWLMSVLLALLVGVGGAAPDAAAEPDATANAGWGEAGAGSASGGGISNTAARSDSPAHAMSPDGSPVVVWDEDRGDGEEIYLRRWNGSAWAEMGNSANGGGISITPGASTSPAVVVGADGAPIVAWQAIAGADSEIYIRRWNGANWVEMGSGSATGGGISNNAANSHMPALALDAGGAPIVAWHDAGGGDWEIYARRWNGSAWVEMGSGAAAGGGISNNSGSSQLPALAVGPDGASILTWQDNSNGNWEIYVLRWNGSSWAEMGSGSAAGGGISNNSGSSQRPRAIVTPDNTPIIAWDDDSGGDIEIYVRRWNGSAWVEMGSGSASGGGISNNNGASRTPSLAIASGGQPIIGWEDQSGTNWEIYARRWNGLAWAEMASGSATGGGISNNAGNSYTPGLVVAPDGRVFVAWADATHGNYEIYARSNPPLDTGACYSLAANTSGSGSVSVSPSLSCHNAGTVVTLTATANPGHTFIGWSGDISGNTNPYALTMNSNKSVTATFAPTCYTLTLTRGGDIGGGIPAASPAASSGCPNGQYTVGQLVTLTASPSMGWRVGAWWNTDNDDSTANINYVSMPPGNHTAGVIYEEDMFEPECYRLTFTHVGQGADPTTNQTSMGCWDGFFTPGDLLALTAAPAAGWHVAGWSGTNDDASTSTSNNLNMPTGDHTVSVTYEQNAPSCYALSLTRTGSGGNPTASPANSGGCANGRYTAGQAISLTAAPAAGHRVKSWSGTANDNSTSTTNSLTMPAADHSASVTYEAIPTGTTYRFFVPAALNQPSTCFAGPDEREDNNNPSQADNIGPLCGSGEYTGLPNDSWDYYAIDLSQTGSIAATVNYRAGNGLQLHLFDKDEKSLIYDSEESDGLRISRSGLAPGRYYVGVHTSKPNVAETRPYRLTVSFP